MSDIAWIAHPLLLSVKALFCSFLLLITAGLAISYFLAFSKAKFKKIVEILVIFPLIFPPIATGFLLLYVFGKSGFIGSSLNLDIVFNFSSLDEFRQNYNAQAGKLSVEQADRLDIELKDRGNFDKFKRPAHGFGPHRSQAAPGECGHMPHKGMGDGTGLAMPPRGDMPCNQNAGAAPCPMAQ